MVYFVLDNIDKETETTVDIREKFQNDCLKCEIN